MDEEIPEEVKTDLSLVERATAEVSFEPNSVRTLLLEDMLGYKTFLHYLSEGLSQKIESTELLELILRILENKASSKVDYDLFATSFEKTLENFKIWAQVGSPATCRLTIAFGKVYLGEAVRKPLKVLLL